MTATETRSAVDAHATTHCPTAPVCMLCGYRRRNLHPAVAVSASEGAFCVTVCGECNPITAPHYLPSDSVIHLAKMHREHAEVGSVHDRTR